MLDGSGITYLDDFLGATLKLWLSNQRGTRDDFGKQTSNHYIEMMRKYSRWCQKECGRHNESV